MRIFVDWKYISGATGIARNIAENGASHRQIIITMFLSILAKFEPLISESLRAHDIIHEICHVVGASGETSCFDVWAHA